MTALARLFVTILALAASIDALVVTRADRYYQKNPVGSCGMSNTTAERSGTKALYFMTNQANNSIVALPVASNGSLSEGTLVATGGAGGNLIDITTNKPSAPDALSSQDSVKVVSNLLFVVNAGSNSLTMFTIDPQHPTTLKMIGQPGATGGDFPTSVAASSILNTACVAHTGAKSGISCAKFDATTGLQAFDALRPFNLGQSNPPTGPLNGIGDTFFDEHSSALITTVKGNPTVNNTGFVSTFPVNNGCVSMQDTRVSPTGTAVLFGTAPIPGTTNLLITDASFGSATLDLHNLSAPIATTNLTDQKATCWAAVSELTGTGFVTDVAVNHLVEVDLDSGAVVKELNSTNGNPGMIDLQTVGHNVFALSPGNGTTPAAVSVFDISGGRGSAKEVQNFAVQGADKNAQGMALFP